jgi:anti-anti-sigma regulatory factor
MAAATPPRKARGRQRPQAEVTLTESEHPAVAVYQLQSHLTIAQAAQLLEDLKKATSSASSLEVSAEAVERIDGTCLQVLLSAELTMRSSGRSLKIVKPSEFFSHAVALLGLTEWLGAAQGDGGAS